MFKYCSYIGLIFTVLLGSACQHASNSDAGPTATEIARAQISAEARNFLFNGQQALGQGAMRQALAMSDSAVKHAPELSDTHFLRARVLSEMKQYDEAEASYKAALKLDPSYRLANFNLGNIAFNRDRFQEALTHYIRTLGVEAFEDLTPDNLPQDLDIKRQATTLVHIARTYIKLGEYDLSKKTYDLALKVDSTDAVVYSDIGVMARDDGNLEDAILYAKKAMQYDAGNISYRYFLGALLVQNGMHEEAIPLLESVLEKQPWQQGVHFNLGQALVRSGRMEEGRRLLARADTMQMIQTDIDQLKASIEQQPNHIPHWLTLGIRYIQSYRYNDALDAFNFVLRQAPSNEEAKYYLAVTQYRMGDAPRARFTLRSILRDNPDQKEARELLVRITE